MEFTSVDQLVGQNVGSYQVERLLERGRASAVYLAFHPAHRRPVALTTFLFPEKHSSAARHRFLQRFQSEGMRLTRLREQHILPIYACGEQKGCPYLITPYMTNGSLVDVMKHQKQFQYADVLALLQEVMAGLAYAHAKGTVHGTLKPSNIILGDQGQTLVAGFGLKDLLQMRGIAPDDQPYGHLLGISGTFLTPPEYVAPEVVQGEVGDPRSDIYSLDIILFELLSGKLPFTGTNPLEVAQKHVQQQVPPLRSFCPDIPLLLAVVVNQAVERNPDRRFQGMDELAEAFTQISAAFSEEERPLRQAEDPRGKGIHTRNEDLPETPAHGYAMGNWQIQPSIVTSKLDAVEPGIQKHSSATRETSASPKIRRNAAQSRIFPGVNGASSLPDQLVIPPHLSPRSAPPTLVPPVHELATSIPLPSESRGDRVAESPGAMPFDGWMTPPQGPLLSPSANISLWNEGANRKRSTSNRRSRSSQKQRIRENPRVSRRKAIALLATGGVAAAASATTILGIRHIIGR